jgi:predicted PurR-regulated permease PerM
VRPHANRADAGASRHATGGRGLVVLGVVAACAGACLLWGLVFARQALLLVYVSALLAIGLAPVVRVLERRGLVPGVAPLPRWGAVTVVYVLFGAAALAILILVVPTLIGQTQDLVRNAPALLHHVQRWLIAQGALARELPVGELVRETPGTTNAVGALVLTVWTLLAGLVGTVTIVVLSFYFLIETDAILAAFVRAFPRRHRLHVRAIARQITDKVSAWLSGQVLVAGLIGATAAVALGLMGVPYFYVLAVVAAVGELIPLLGPVLASIPAIGAAASVSWQLAIATAAFFVVQQQIENHVLVPRVMSSHVGVSPVAVIVAVLVGASWFGIVGAILAIPTTAIVQVVFYELVPATEE